MSTNVSQIVALTPPILKVLVRRGFLDSLMLVLILTLQVDGIMGFGGCPQPPEAKPDDFKPLKRSHILIDNNNNSSIMSLVTGYYNSLIMSLATGYYNSLIMS